MPPPRTHPDPPPPSVPKSVYRVDYPGSQTAFTPTGFLAKNQTTVISTPTQLSHYALPHLHWSTNISSPFISVFGDRGHAERWARAISSSSISSSSSSSFQQPQIPKSNVNDCIVSVVEIDTGKLASGPIFRAADLLKGEDLGPEEEGRHWSEYLVLYCIPVEAVREEVLVVGGGGGMATWEGLGLF